MKHSRIFRHFAIFAVAITSIMTLSAFTTATKVEDNASREVLNLMVKEMKKELPQKVDESFVFSDVYIANNNLVMEFICPEEVVNMVRLGWSMMNKQETMNDVLKDEDMKSIAKMCVEAECGMRYVCLTSSRSNQTELFFSVSDLKAFTSTTTSTTTKTADNSTNEFMRAMVNEMKKELPLDIGGGLIMTDAYLTNSYFVIEYTCADSVINLARESMKLMSKESFMQYAFKEEAARLLGKMCAEANYGLRMLFVNKERNNTLDMSFSAEELKKHLK